jgi:hypothetical protein
MFEPSLKLLRHGGRQAVMASVGNGRIQWFGPGDFYRSLLGLTGVRPTP